MKKKSTFLSQLQKTVTTALMFLRACLKEGQVMTIYNDVDTGTEEFYELPVATHFGKHGDFTEYAIISVEKRNGNIILHTISKNEDETKKEFPIEDIEDVSLCQLADLITEKTKYIPLV